MNIKLFPFNNINRSLLVKNVALICQSAKITSFNKSIFIANNNFIGPQQQLSVFPNYKTQFPSIIGRGFKGDKKKTKKDDSSDDDDDDDGKDLLKSKDSALNRDSKIVTAMVTTMRADALYKAIQKTSRSKIDTMFYEGRLRLNGKLLMKKSTHINVGDEMDVIKALSPHNKEFLNISRIEVMKVEADEDQIALKARYFKNLLIENYKDNPWSPTMKVKEEDDKEKKP